MNGKIARMQSVCQDQNAIVQFFRELIRNRIEERELKQKDLAELIGVRKDDISRLIGKNPRGGAKIEVIAKVLIELNLLNTKAASFEFTSSCVQKLSAIYGFIEKHKDNPSIEAFIQELKHLLR